MIDLKCYSLRATVKKKKDKSQSLRLNKFYTIKDFHKSEVTKNLKNYYL